MKLGKEAMEALQAEICGLLTPGDELVVAGAIALEGTTLLARENYDRLRTHFSESFLREAMELQEKYGCCEKRNFQETGSINEMDLEINRKCCKTYNSSEITENQAWNCAKKAGATALYAMNEGGFLSALWKMAEASQVGLEVDFKKIPIRQETIEICEIFDINPYKLLSGGAFLIGIPAGEALVQKLHRMGFMAAVIGQTNNGNDRLLYYNENARFLERPGKDEIYKVKE